MVLCASRITRSTGWMEDDRDCRRIIGKGVLGCSIGFGMPGAGDQRARCIRRPEPEFNRFRSFRRSPFSESTKTAIESQL
jgi:hypothetical protein